MLLRGVFKCDIYEMCEIRLDLDLFFKILFTKTGSIQVAPAYMNMIVTSECDGYIAYDLIRKQKTRL